jgi:hypothetical protein
MKIIVKTLKGEKFPIDVESSSTVETIKQIIVRFRVSIGCCLFCALFGTPTPNLLEVVLSSYNTHMKY